MLFPCLELKTRPRFGLFVTKGKMYFNHETWCTGVAKRLAVPLLPGVGKYLGVPILEGVLAVNAGVPNLLGVLM